MYSKHVSSHKLFKDISTVKEIRRRIERAVRHIFLRVKSGVINKPVMSIDGMKQETDPSTVSYAALKQIIHHLYQHRDSICGITTKIKDGELRAFLSAIVLVRLQIRVEIYGPLPTEKIGKWSEHGSRNEMSESGDRSFSISGQNRAIVGCQIQVPYSCFRTRPFLGSSSRNQCLFGWFLKTITFRCL